MATDTATSRAARWAAVEATILAALELEKAEPTEEVVGTCVSKIGFPEVDSVLRGSVFATPQTTNSLPTQERVSIQSQNFDIPSSKFSRIKTNSALSVDKSTTTDHINRLPNDILQFIISRLTIKEGAATGVLSRRWRNLWTTSISLLNFDLFNKVGCNHLIENEYTLDRLRTDKSFLWTERCKFTTWVNQVLQIHSASKINALRISFLLGKESASHLNHWIQCVANNGLTELELDFDLLYWVGLSSCVAYDFPLQLLSSSLNYMRLSCVNFNFPPDFKGFNSLKSLTLRDTYLTEDSLHNILSNCSSLECLSLLSCFLLGFPSILKFSGPSLQLKHLRLTISCDNIKKIELHDVSIISFEFHGIYTKLSIKNAPRLARLVLCTKTPVDILSEVPRVETLFMTTWLRAKESILPKLHVFNNLKQLVFVVNNDSANLLEVISLLETCPSMQKLELDMGIWSDEYSDDLIKIATRPGSPYKNLKEIEIYGFQDHVEKIELIRYILRNAIVLEKMKIFTTSRKYLGNGEWTLYESTAKPTRTSLREIWKLLKKEVSSSTELKIVSNQFAE